jgi:hypothetical protein
MRPGRALVLEAGVRCGGAAARAVRLTLPLVAALLRHSSATM